MSINNAQRPAHVRIFEILILRVEDDSGKRRIGMAVGESLEPGPRRLALLGEGEHALRRDVVDHVELVVELRDHPLIGRPGIDISEIFRTRLAEARQRGALPVVAKLPDVPFAVGIVAVQHIGAERDRLVEVEFDGILDLVEDMLGQDPHRAPAHREIGVEARIGFF